MWSRGVRELSMRREQSRNKFYRLVSSRGLFLNLSWRQDREVGLFSFFLEVLLV